MNITLADYYMSRDKMYPMALSSEVIANATRTVTLVNELLVKAALFGVSLPKSPRTGTFVASGWRPPSINALTPNAAPNSKHMTGQACDIYDPDGDLDTWLMSEKGRGCLEAIGLWMEHPGSTKGWSHIQTIPPNSGNRVFYP